MVSLAAGEAAARTPKEFGIARRAGIDFDGGTLPCVLVNDGEGSKRSAAGEGVADEIHRPSLVGFCQCWLLWPWLRSPRILDGVSSSA